MFKMIKDMFFGNRKHSFSYESENYKFSKSLSKNIERLKGIFKDDEMIIFREFETKNAEPLKCCIVFADGMVNKEIINENIIKPIVDADEHDFILNENVLDNLKDKIIIAGEVEKQSDIYELASRMLYGETILIIDGYKEGLIIDTKGFSTRAITEPLAETLVRGPREGFTESVITNLTMIRRKLITPDLKFRFKEIGKRSRTKVCICYIEGIVNEKIVEEVNKRLDDINIDGILESGYIEELIQDSPLSPFQTIYYTERPDIIAANLLEGRVAVVIDGTPIVLTMPNLFIEYFQSPEDYYSNFLFSSFNRILRIAAWFIATSLPAIYVALTTYHQEMIPTPLILSISAAREGLPFPTIVEALFMILTFDTLREGGIRLPAPIGSTIGFIGAVILGQSAVVAKIVSAPIVIVAGITGISNFLIPKMIGPMIFIRLFFLGLSAMLGLYGYIFGLIALSIHLMSMRSFGIPYMLNSASLKGQEVKDTFIRAPWWVMQLRPKLMADNNQVRQKDPKKLEKS